MRTIGPAGTFLILLGVLAAVPVQAQTPPGICGRTQQVQDGILNRLSGVSDCAEVTTTHLTTVTELTLESVGLTSLKADDFAGLTDLKELRLKGNYQLLALPSGVFSGLAKLETLDLYNNQFHQGLPAGVFSGLTKLETLNLGANRIPTLRAEAFSGLSVMETLNLGVNRLPALPDGVFSGLAELETLDLGGNDLTEVPVEVFSDISALKTLILRWNQIGSLPDGAFYDLPNLEKLDLFHNLITALPPRVFSGLTKLKVLMAGSNQLVALPDGVFAGLTMLDTLDVAENPVHPLLLTVTVEIAGSDRVRAKVPAGAPFAMSLPVSVTNGGLAGGASTLEITAGAVVGEAVAVTRTEGTTEAVTVDLGTPLPSPPMGTGPPYPQRGYAFVRAPSGLPVKFVLPAWIRNVRVVSGPGADGVWSAGERVELEVRYSLPVVVEQPEDCWSYNDDGRCRDLGPYVLVAFRSDARPGYGVVLSTPLAPYVGGSGTATLRFTYTVGAAEDGARGVWAADDGMLLRGATIRTLAGGDGEPEYTITRVMQVTVRKPGRAAWTAGDTVRVAVRFTGPPQPYAPDTPLDERLNWDKVDVAGGTPTIDLLLGDRERRTLARTASYVGGSGTNTLAFEYEVTAGDGRVGAVEVEAKSLASNGATIRNERGYDAELDHLGAVRYAQRPSLSVADAEATEGEDATLDFVVKLDGNSGSEVTVDYRTRDGTAEAGTDYTETRGRLTFDPGEYEKTVEVPIRDDAEEDDGETFTLLLSNVSGAGVANDDYEAVGTIRNDDAQESESESEPDPPREPESDPAPPPPPPPRVSVADARAEEGKGATLDFAVTLSRASSETVKVHYRTVDGNAKAGADYKARQGALRFSAGETLKTISVPVLDDAHDEGEEKMGLVLYRAAGAIRADYLAVGTIENSDPLQRAWLARFGRMAALQVIDHVAARLDARRDPGFRGRIAGRELHRGMGRDLAESFLRRLGGASALGPIGGMAAPIGGMADPLGGGSNPLAAGSGPDGGLDWGRLLRMGLGGGDVMTGSDFALDRETGRGGIVSVWSRGSMSRFTGREGALSLGGDVRTTMFGADYAQGPLVAGLMLSHSRGLGEYAGVDAGLLRSSVTGLYPWLGYRATKRISVWAVTGYGTGGLMLTPEGVASLRSGLSMAMVAAGARGALAGVAGSGGGTGIGLSFKAAALWVGTSIAGVDGPAGSLKGASSSVTRVRTALEGSGGFTFGSGLSLKPSVEVGLRHDGGDAESGSGLDLGGGLVVADASTGLVVDVRARTLLAHEAEGFSERGVSVQFSWNPSP